MTDAEQDWDDPDRVDRWVDRHARRPVLRSARELAVALVGLDAEPPATVVELAGGAGTPWQLLSTVLVRARCPVPVGGTPGRAAPGG